MEDAAEDEEDVLVVLLLWLLHLLLSLPFSELVVVIVVAVEEDEALSLRVDVLDVVEDAPSNSMSENDTDLFPRDFAFFLPPFRLLFVAVFLTQATEEVPTPIFIYRDQTNFCDEDPLKSFFCRNRLPESLCRLALSPKISAPRGI